MVSEAKARSELEKRDAAEFHEPNVFFWIPADMKGDMRNKFMHEQVHRMFVQLRSPKQGGWEPLRGENATKVTLMPVTGVPVYHAMFREGHDTILVREQEFHLHWDDDRCFHRDLITGRMYRQCNRIRFKRSARYNAPMWLPDEIALKLQREGKFKVLEWDNPESAMKVTEEGLSVPTPRQGRKRVRKPVPW